MKLRDLDIIVTAPPAPGWGGRYWQLVKLTTDDGNHRLGRGLCRRRGARRDGGG